MESIRSSGEVGPRKCGGWVAARSVNDHPSLAEDAETKSLQLVISIN